MGFVCVQYWQCGGVQTALLLCGGEASLSVQTGSPGLIHSYGAKQADWGVWGGGAAPKIL